MVRQSVDQADSGSPGSGLLGERTEGVKVAALLTCPGTSWVYQWGDGLVGGRDRKRREEAGRDG